MTYNLFDISYRVAREIGALFEGTATGGSVATIIDTNNLSKRFDDDWFNKGTAWIIYDAGGAAAAPQGEYARVTDFVSSTGTVTHATLTAAVAAGDRYAIATDYWPLDMIIMNINRALEDVTVRTVDTTSLDTAASQTEYTLPTGVLDENIEVWLQRDTNDTDDNRWTRWHDWYITETAVGTAKTLIFRSQPPNIYGIKLVYYIPHPSLNTRLAKLSEEVDLMRIVYMASVYCLLWKRSQKAVEDPELDRKIAELTVRAEARRAKRPLKRSEIKLAVLGYTDNYNDFDNEA